MDSLRIVAVHFLEDSGVIHAQEMEVFAKEI